MSKDKVARVLAVLAALWAITHPALQLAIGLGSYASQDAVGVRIFASTGEVLSVNDASNAASAGLHAGDRIDFERTGPLMHLWLWDSLFPV
ncbi:MAG TPA: hypothetical protein VKB39_03900, partial [Candidatus Baltobacteraceae bacterium]|nr:hypothetical protein [Candidatus Baltobacteraceae bacterium]